jgi:AcrR family transcriptional regulator
MVRPARYEGRMAVDVPPDDSSRARILRAARAAFAESGLAGARVDAIARASGCNKQLIYHYFGDKQGLYAAVVHDVLCARPPVALTDAENLGDLLARVAEDEIPARREWLRMMAWEGLADEGEPVVAEELRRANLEAVVAHVTGAQEAGVIVRRPPARFLLLAVMSVAMLPYLLPQLARLLTGLHPDSDAFRREHAALLREVGRWLTPRDPSA